MFWAFSSISVANMVSRYSFASLAETAANPTSAQRRLLCTRVSAREGGSL
jgi:hypothetical protein